MNSVMKTILERRSVRSFDQTKTVKEQDLFEILKAGAYAPSALNKQAWHFTVIMNKEKLLLINEAVKATMGKSDIERISARSKDNTYNFYYHAPVLIVVSMSDEAVYPREDAACALQNMFLAAESLKIGSCWINQLGNGADSDTKVKELLNDCGVPNGNKVYGCAAIGYADGVSPLKDRAKHTVNFFK